MGGFLVGFGSRLANGDTAYHGFSGLPIFSKRSMTAMSIFTLSAICMATLRFYVPFLKGNSAHKLVGNVWIIAQYIMLGLIIVMLGVGLYRRIKEKNWQKFVISFVTGALYGFGLMVSGLLRFSLVLKFLTINKDWSITAGVVLATAALINCISFQII